MAVIQYPSTLPGVSTFNGQPTTQVLATGGEGAPQAYRRRSRVPGSTDQVGWRFLEGDYAIFIAWWRETLLFGHRWFYIRLPSAEGIRWHVARFADKNYAAKLQGHRYWEVTAELEVREGPTTLPQVLLYYTSQPYPISTIESMDFGFSVVSGNIWVQPIDFLDFGFSALSGTLTAILQTYSAPTEPLDLGFAVLSGTLETILLTYSIPVEPIDLGFTVLSGTLVVVLITYNNWPTEPLDLGFTVLSGTLT